MSGVMFSVIVVVVFVPVIITIVVVDTVDIVAVVGVIRYNITLYNIISINIHIIEYTL